MHSPVCAVQKCLGSQEFVKSFNNTNNLRAATRGPITPDFQYFNIGFRCSR